MTYNLEIFSQWSVQTFIYTDNWHLIIRIIYDFSYDLYKIFGTDSIDLKFIYYCR